MLVCPVCHGTLEWNIVNQVKDRIETAEAQCTACAATYPVRETIGVFLAPDQQGDDLWEQESRQMRYLREHPEVERQLLEAPLETLNPADRLFRAKVLEARGQYLDAKTAADRAQEGLYTAASQADIESQFDPDAVP